VDDRGFDLEAMRLLRLRQDLDAWFPGDVDATLREDLLRGLAIGVREGLDPLPLLHFLRARAAPPGATAEASAAPGRDPRELEMEVLPKPRCATLWPYRPKRKPDELLSSWLWRVARGLGAPPRRFVRDAVGADLADVDREISDAALQRLAFLSGQSVRHLVHGTLRSWPPARPVQTGLIDLAAYHRERRERARQALLLHGGLVLNRCRGGRGRAVPIVQYCPVCLADDKTAYLRRGWRLSLEVACFEDGCFLLDACWKCGAVIDPLAHSVPYEQFACARCGACLSKAPSLHMPESVQDQTTLYKEIHRKAFFVTGDFVGLLGEEYMTMLASGDLRGTNPTNAADRHNAVMLEAAWLRAPVRWSRAGDATEPAKAKRSRRTAKRATDGGRGPGPKRAAAAQRAPRPARASAG